jgi:hypothetical protein
VQSNRPAAQTKPSSRPAQQPPKSATRATLATTLNVPRPRASPPPAELRPKSAETRPPANVAPARIAPLSQLLPLKQPKQHRKTHIWRLAATFCRLFCRLRRLFFFCCFAAKFLNCLLIVGGRGWGGCCCSLAVIFFIIVSLLSATERGRNFSLFLFRKSVIGLQTCPNVNVCQVSHFVYISEIQICICLVSFSFLLKRVKLLAHKFKFSNEKCFAGYVLAISAKVINLTTFNKYFKVC